MAAAPTPDVILNSRFSRAEEIKANADAAADVAAHYAEFVSGAKFSIMFYPSVEWQQRSSKKNKHHKKGKEL
jgi:hypothetical protein